MERVKQALNHMHLTQQEIAFLVQPFWGKYIKGLDTTEELLAKILTTWYEASQANQYDVKVAGAVLEEHGVSPPDYTRPPFQSRQLS